MLLLPRATRLLRSKAPTQTTSKPSPAKRSKTRRMAGGPTRPYRWSWGPASARWSSRPAGRLGSPGDPGRLAIARSTERTGRCCSHTPAGYAGRAAAPACLRARGVEGRSWNAPLRWAPGGFQAFAKKRMRGSATTAGRKTRLDAIQSVRLTGYRRFSPMRPIVPRRSAASWRQPKDHTLLAAFAVISVEQRRFVVPPDAGARDCF